jgi:putative hydrolase of the HAD superfamily
VESSWDDAKQAMLAEMTYYKQHHDEGRDAASLAELRRRCANVLRAKLPEVAKLSDADLTEALLASLRFAPYPDVPDALARLRALGARLAVVSNWDCSLGATLAELGIGGLVDEVVVSAEVGSRKPAARIFEEALDRVSATPQSAWLVGDSPETDIAGAIAVGIRPLLLDRMGRAPDSPGVTRVFTLADVPELAGATP